MKRGGSAASPYCKISNTKNKAGGKSPPAPRPPSASSAPPSFSRQDFFSARFPYGTQGALRFPYGTQGAQVPAKKPASLAPFVPSGDFGTGVGVFCFSPHAKKSSILTINRTASLAPASCIKRGRRTRNESRVAHCALHSVPEEVVMFVNRQYKDSVFTRASLRERHPG